MGLERNGSEGVGVWWVVEVELTVPWYGWENSLNLWLEAGKFSHLCVSCVVVMNVNCSGRMLID